MSIVGLHGDVFHLHQSDFTVFTKYGYLCNHGLVFSNAIPSMKYSNKEEGHRHYIIARMCVVSQRPVSEK